MAGETDPLVYSDSDRSDRPMGWRPTTYLPVRSNTLRMEPRLMMENVWQTDGVWQHRAIHHLQCAVLLKFAIKPQRSGERNHGPGVFRSEFVKAAVQGRVIAVPQIAVVGLGEDHRAVAAGRAIAATDSLQQHDPQPREDLAKVVGGGQPQKTTPDNHHIRIDIMGQGR